MFSLFLKFIACIFLLCFLFTVILILHASGKSEYINYWFLAFCFFCNISMFCCYYDVTLVLGFIQFFILVFMVHCIYLPHKSVFFNLYCLNLIFLSLSMFENSLIFCISSFMSLLFFNMISYFLKSKVKFVLIFLFFFHSFLWVMVHFFSVDFSLFFFAVYLVFFLAFVIMVLEDSKKFSNFGVCFVNICSSSSCFYVFVGFSLLAGVIMAHLAGVIVALDFVYFFEASKIACVKNVYGYNIGSGVWANHSWFGENTFSPGLWSGASPSDLSHNEVLVKNFRDDVADLSNHLARCNPHLGDLKNVKYMHFSIEPGDKHYYFKYSIYTNDATFSNLKLDEEGNRAYAKACNSYFKLGELSDFDHKSKVEVYRKYPFHETPKKIY